MPDGLVQSFIDTIGTSDDFVRDARLGPTVRLDVTGDTVTVDRTYGEDGLGAWADVPSNVELRGERRWSPRCGVGGWSPYAKSFAGAMSAKRLKWPWNATSMVAVGPLRCLATIRSASPGRVSLS
ncbi:hypothetical protein [Microbacterium lacusdiani]